MTAILNGLGQIDVIVVLWLFPVAFALHEAEEWNILGWYRRNYVDLPRISHQSNRTWLIFASIVCFGWCAVATLPGSPTIAAFVFLPAIAIALQNTLQHIYWLFYFGEHAPGVITSLLLLLPLGIYLTVRAILQNHVPIWYAVVLALLMAPGLVQTAKAGHRLTPQMRTLHGFSIRLSDKLAALF